ncbi:UDP-N-acetylglucosamine 2-epimerase [Catovirus CTV1]|uniref:UDP-N-acetylglucosamine 2-epimerase n=1 Tax=Catovirus CTV1 TaxID=1977631 RepID=A0A1V0SAG5_9VIRU|nr:UDP-N-acetylglucosamine 2-epimerase [Catovirus CTV1]
MKKKIIIVTGARPNIMKAFAVYKSLQNNYDITLIHTGQHYDYDMSDIFFDELRLKPDIKLNLESKTKAGMLDNFLYNNNNIFEMDVLDVVQHLLSSELKKCGQLGEIIIKLEKFIKDMCLVITFGDVTSTLAAALCCHKLNIKIAHIESGLRNFDNQMPEEINRYIVDHISNYNFCSEKSGLINLINEGITKDCYLVGNTMLETLRYNLDEIKSKKSYLKYEMEPYNYVLLTLHRHENVDNKENLDVVLTDLIKLSEKYKIIWPVHPRTKKSMYNLDIVDNIILIDPQGYLDFTCLQYYSKFIITDSGGIQEEANEMGITCFTLRKNTERPSTLIENGGTNILIHSIKEINEHIIVRKDNSINDHTPSHHIANILKKVI